LAIELAYGIEIGHKFMPSRKALDYFDLQVLLGSMDAHTIVSSKMLQQVNALVHQAVPGFTVLVFEGGIPERTPFSKKSGRTILLLKPSQNTGQRSSPRESPSPASHRDSGSDSCAGNAGSC
jgi:hypothetical protein